MRTWAGFVAKNAPAAPAVISLTYKAHAFNSAQATNPSFASQPIGAADTNRFVIVAITHYDPSGRNANVTGVTIGGVTATLYDQWHIAVQGGLIAVAPVPAGTTATIAITGSTSQNYWDIHVYTAISPTGLLNRVDGIGVNKSSTWTQSLVTTDGGVIIFKDAAVSGTNTTFTLVGVTQDQTSFQGSPTGYTTCAAHADNLTAGTLTVGESNVGTAQSVVATSFSS